MFFFCCTNKEDDDIGDMLPAELAAKYKSGAVDGIEDLGDGDGTSGKLVRITIVGAKNLRNVVRGVTMRAKSSPFVKATVDNGAGTVAFETQVCKRNLNPKWQESFDVVDYKAGSPINFEVFHPAVKKTPEISLGTCSLPAEEFKGGCETVMNVDDPGAKNKKKLAALSVKVEWVNPTYTEKRISCFQEQPAQLWLVRYKSIGLRSGPGVHEKRVNIDLKPGEQFEVVETVEGADGQEYLRLKDGRGWAFIKSPKTGEYLAEKVLVEEKVVVEDEGDAKVDNEEEAATTGEEAKEPEEEASHGFFK